MYVKLATLAFAAAGMTVLVAPAQAAVHAPVVQHENAAACANNDDSVDWNDDSGTVASQLAERGLKFSSVEQWGSCYRVYATNSRGQTFMEILDPTTLKPVFGTG